MKTTQKKFWEVLSTIKFVNEYEDRGYWIRQKSGGGRVCPVCAVANKILGERIYRHEAATAAERIELDLRFANRVAYASDGLSTKLLKKLLKVTGIKEVK